MRATETGDIRRSLNVAIAGGSSSSTSESAHDVLEVVVAVEGVIAIPSRS